MSDDPHGLGRMPSDASLTPPPPLVRGARYAAARVVDRAARAKGLALHDVPSARASAARSDQAGREADLVPIPRIRCFGRQGSIWTHEAHTKRCFERLAPGV